MFSNPIAVSASSPTPALNFKIIQQDGVGSVRFDAVNNFNLVFTHSNPLDNGSKAERHYLKVSQTKDATSPYTGLTSKQSASISLSMSIPPYGWTAAEKVALIKLLDDILAANTAEVKAGLTLYES
jgi:hypothetical protein